MHVDLEFLTLTVGCTTLHEAVGLCPSLAVRS